MYFLWLSLSVWTIQCTCVCLCVRAHARVCTCAGVCIRMCMCVRTCRCKHRCACACMGTHACVLVFLIMFKQKLFLPTSFPAFLVWFFCGRPVLWTSCFVDILFCGRPVFQLWSTGILVPILNLYARRRWVVSAMPRPINSFEIGPVPSVQEAEWVQKMFPLRFSTLDCPAHSKSLYRPPFPGRTCCTVPTVFTLADALQPNLCFFP